MLRFTALAFTGEIRTAGGSGAESESSEGEGVAGGAVLAQLAAEGDFLGITKLQSKDVGQSEGETLAKRPPASMISGIRRAMLFGTVVLYLSIHDKQYLNYSLFWYSITI